MEAFSISVDRFHHLKLLLKVSFFQKFKKNLLGAANVLQLATAGSQHRMLTS